MTVHKLRALSPINAWYSSNFGAAWDCLVSPDWKSRSSRGRDSRETGSYVEMAAGRNIMA